MKLPLSLPLSVAFTFRIPFTFAVGGGWSVNSITTYYYSPGKVNGLGRAPSISHSRNHAVTFIWLGMQVDPPWPLPHCGCVACPCWHRLLGLSVEHVSIQQPQNMPRRFLHRHPHLFKKMNLNWCLNAMKKTIETVVNVLKSAEQVSNISTPTSNWTLEEVVHPTTVPTFSLWLINMTFPQKGINFKFWLHSSSTTW